MQHFQILADCPHCLIEGAVLELYDQSSPCCHLGVALESRCRFCKRQTQGQTNRETPTPTCAIADDRCPFCTQHLPEQARVAKTCNHCDLQASEKMIVHPIDLHDPQELQRALQLWAAEDGAGSTQEFLEVSFGELSQEEIFARIQKHQRTETSFDVLGFLFSNIGGGAGAFQGGADDVQTVSSPTKSNEEDSIWGFAPTARIQLPTERMPNKRNRGLALISVMAVDGQVRQAELNFVNKFLAEEGLEPVNPTEICVRRPHEVGPVGTLKDPERLVHTMVQLAYIDEERDESELRMIREFARHWGVDPARIDNWEQSERDKSASQIRRIADKVKALLMA